MTAAEFDLQTQNLISFSFGLRKLVDSYITPSRHVLFSLKLREQKLQKWQWDPPKSPKIWARIWFLCSKLWGPWYLLQNWQKHFIKQILMFVFLCLIFFCSLFAWKWHFEQWSVADAGLSPGGSVSAWVCISCCGNCCSGRAGALLLGGKGAAGAEEYLNHPSFMQRSLQNYTHQGKMKLRSHTKWNGLKNVSTPCLSSWQCQIRNQLCCRRNKVYWSLQGNGQSYSQTIFTWLG